MTLPFNSEQLKGVYNLFQTIINDKPADHEGLLLMTLLKRVYKKLRNAIESTPKAKYSISLSDEEALAYLVYFKHNQPEGWVYELNTIRPHITLIDNKYASHIKRPDRKQLQSGNSNTRMLA